MHTTVVRSSFACLLVGGSLLLGGCAARDSGGGGAGGAGGVSGGEAGAVGVAVGADPFEGLRSIGFRLDWKGFAILQSGATLRTLTPLGETVVAQDSRNVITALEAGTGAIRWADAVPNALDTYRGHFLRGETLVSVTQSDITIRDLRNGTLVDRQRLSVLANTDAVHVDPVIVYGSTIGEAVGHNLATGFKQWGNRLDDTIRVRPAVAGDGGVVVVSNSGQMLVIDPGSGLARGRRNTAFEGVDSRPVVDGSRAYIASRDRSVWAFNLFDGSQAWRYRTEAILTTQPALHDGSLYLEVPGEGFVALDASSGARRWANAELSGELVGVRRGRLLVWDAGMGTLSSVLPSNGSVAHRHVFSLAEGMSGGVDAGSRPAFMAVEGFEDPNLYLVYGGGTIERFIPR